MAKVDLGEFSPDETKELLKECMGQLLLHEVIEVLKEVFPAKDDRDEIFANFCEDE